METLWSILIGVQVLVGAIGTIFSSIYAATTDNHNLPLLPLLFAFIFFSGVIAAARDSDLDDKDSSSTEQTEEVTA